MKKCKIYSTKQNKEAEAVIIDGRVLVQSPRLTDKRPARTIDGQCYYPPEIASFARGMSLMPFSVECEWGEYGECRHDYLGGDFIPSDENDPRPAWAQNYEINDINEKWGYCSASTGEIKIVPQWEHCDDFDEENCFARVKGVFYGLVTDSGEPLLNEKYGDIRLTGHDLVLVMGRNGHWGACGDPDWDSYYIVSMKWEGIWWDGSGGFIVMRKEQDGRERYRIFDGRCRDIVVDDLTEKPERWVPTRETTYINNSPTGFLYIIKRGDSYGLVSDYDDRSSRVLLEPTHTYDYVCDAARKEEREAEIDYYVYVMSRTPKFFPERIGDGWDTVAEDIRDDVRKRMEAKGLKQPETVADTQPNLKHMIITQNI